MRCLSSLADFLCHASFCTDRSAVHVHREISPQNGRREHGVWRMDLEQFSCLDAGCCQEVYYAILMECLALVKLILGKRRRNLTGALTYHPTDPLECIQPQTQEQKF